MVCMVKHVINPSTKKKDLFWVQGLPNIHREFQAIQDYIARPCLNLRDTLMLRASLLPHERPDVSGPAGATLCP